MFGIVCPSRIAAAIWRSCSENCLTASEARARMHARDCRPGCWYRFRLFAGQVRPSSGRTFAGRHPKDGAPQAGPKWLCSARPPEIPPAAP